MRRLIAPFALVFSAALLSACSASPTPSPTPSAAAACDPDAAEITWSPVEKVGQTPVGAYRLSYAAGATEPTVEVIDFDTPLSYSTDALDALVGSDDDQRDAWEAALLADLHRTGQVGTDFGDPIALPAATPPILSEPQESELVVAVGHDTAVAKYEITCADGTTSRGQIAGAGNDTTTNTLVDCAAPPADADVVIARALEECPAT